jgi:hypothetical protein
MAGSMLWEQFARHGRGRRHRRGAGPQTESGYRDLASTRAGDAAPGKTATANTAFASELNWCDDIRLAQSGIR